MNNLDLYLYRHGNTFESHETPVQVGLRSDLRLTQRGQEQAHLFGKYLKSQNITPQKIYCGHLKRQSESAQILQAFFPESELTISPALDEIDYGLWEGLTLEEIQSKWPQEHKDWLNAGIWPKHLFNQSVEEHLSKLKTLLNTLIQKTQNNQPMVLITSNGIIRFFLYFSQLWSDLTKTKQLSEYKVGTGCFCQVKLSEGPIITVDAWNKKP